MHYIGHKLFGKREDRIDKKRQKQGYRIDTVNSENNRILYFVYLDSAIRMMSEAIVIGIVNPISIPLFLSLFVNLILPFYLKSFLPCGIYRIGGIFRGEKFSRILRFRKNYTQKTKNLYGSHLILDRFAKF